MDVASIVDVSASRRAVDVRLAVARGMEDEDLRCVGFDRGIEIVSAFFGAALLVELDPFPGPFLLALQDFIGLGVVLRECSVDQSGTDPVGRTGRGGPASRSFRLRFAAGQHQSGFERDGVFCGSQAGDVKADPHQQDGETKPSERMMLHTIFSFCDRVAAPSFKPATIVPEPICGDKRTPQCWAVAME